MSEIQAINESELQSIELSDAELQNIDGGVWPLAALVFLAAMAYSKSAK